MCQERAKRRSGLEFREPAFLRHDRGQLDLGQSMTTRGAPAARRRASAHPPSCLPPGSMRGSHVCAHRSPTDLPSQTFLGCSKTLNMLLGPQAGDKTAEVSALTFSFKQRYYFNDFYDMEVHRSKELVPLVKLILAKMTS